MTSSNCKMFENHISIHWHYPILRVTKSIFQCISYIKHLLVFLAPNIIFIGQLEKDIGSNPFSKHRRSNFKFIKDNFWWPDLVISSATIQLMQLHFKYIGTGAISYLNILVPSFTLDF